MSPISDSLTHLVLPQAPSSVATSGTTTSSDTTSVFTEVTVSLIATVIIFILIGWCIRVTSLRRAAARPVPYRGNGYPLTPIAVQTSHNIDSNPSQLLLDPPEVVDGITEPPPAYTARGYGKPRD